MPSLTKSAPAKPRSGPSGSPEIVLSDPGPGSGRGEVFLLLHGLNLHPARMAPWRDFLLGRGYAVASVALAGHGSGASASWAGVDADRWLADVDGARDATEARWPGRPISLFGYSLGAPLGLVWGLERGRPWRRAILLVPALRMKWFATPLLAAAAVLLPRRLLLPSFAPRGYRRRATIPLSAYLALAELIRRLRAAQGNTAGPPAEPPGEGCFPQLLLSPRWDELISTRYLVQYRDRLGPRGTLYWLPGAGPWYLPRHLAFDAASLGQEKWRILTDDIAEWLEETE